MCIISKCFSIHFLDIIRELHTIHVRDFTKSCQFYFLSNSFVSFSVISLFYAVQYSEYVT